MAQPATATQQHLISTRQKGRQLKIFKFLHFSILKFRASGQRCMNAADETRSHIGLEISADMRRDLIMLQADRQADTGKRVSLSELAREALAKLIEEHKAKHNV